MRQLAWTVILVGAAACGDHRELAIDAAPGAPDGATDAPIDAGPDQRIATGTHLVTQASLLAGLTTDGYVVFSDTDATGHSVAKLVPLAGGAETVIATSTGTGKDDIRYAIDGQVVFVFTDRGNRSSTLTIWSAATGVLPVGPGVRPGRAAATADGAFVAYERDITATTANLVAGPIAGPAAVIDVANTSDDSCWRETDIESTGRTTGQSLLLRYCSQTSTAWTLASVTAGDATTHALSGGADQATYRSTHVLWRQASGALFAAPAGASTGVLLASDAADFVVSPDETQVAWLTTAGAILERPLDASTPARTLVAAPLAKALGALSPDNNTILFASIVDDRGTGFVQPYTNVLAATAGQAPVTLVPLATSCAGCLHDSFTPDSSEALVLDPIDNSTAADAAGPIHVFALADASTVSTFGQTTWGAVALVGGTGASSRFLALDAARDAALGDGWGYEMTVRTLVPASPETVIARAAETFVVDAARTHAITSFAGSDDIGGVWVVPLAAE